MREEMEGWIVVFGLCHRGWCSDVVEIGADWVYNG